MSKAMIIAMMALCIAIPARADDMVLCLARQVDACTRMIDSGKYELKNRANLFLDRGVAHEAKGELELAIADDSEANRRMARAAYAGEKSAEDVMKGAPFRK